jgi:hypothetical protein
VARELAREMLKEKRCIRLLDFGGGRTAHHKKLYEEPWLKWIVHDLYFEKFPHHIGNHNNISWERVIDNAQNPRLKFDIVLASNVINIQETTQQLADTLMQIEFVSRKAEFVVINYTDTPRKLGIQTDGMLKFVLLAMPMFQLHKKEKGNVWVLSKKK